MIYNFIENIELKTIHFRIFRDFTSRSNIHTTFKFQPVIAIISIINNLNIISKTRWESL